MRWTEDDYRLMMNILSLAEYCYRLGVDHGARVKDPVAIREVAADPHEKKFRLLLDAPSKPMSVNVFCDRAVVWCGYISAINLRDFLRGSIYGQSLKTSILISVYSYYRKGLEDGINVDKYKAREFLDNVGHGCFHEHPITGKVMTKNRFFDEFKFNINQMQDDWAESGAQINLQRLSSFMGKAWALKN